MKHITEDQLQQAIKNAKENRNEEYESKIRKLEDEVSELEDNAPCGPLAFSINTGSDIIEIYMKNGNLRHKETLELLARQMSVPNSEPELL
jgi:hypothetical protein